MVNRSHARLANTAARLIKKNGRLVMLIDSQTTGPEFDPVTTETQTEIMAVESRFKQSEIDGELIQVNDKRFLVDSAVEPDNTMRLLDEGIAYSIKDVVRIKPGSITCLYKIQARL